MPAPRQMRFVDAANDCTPEKIAALVQQLRSGDHEAAALAAQTLYNLTSFTSAVKIDEPSAYTEYDRSVFGGSSVPHTVKPAEETAWVDGKSYKMGDGFMLFTDEGAAADTRRVAVMHSRNATTNRSLIGQTGEVFEALAEAIISGNSETRYHGLRAISQIVFRNTENKQKMGQTPNGIKAISLALMESRASGNKKCLAEACRAMSVVVSGDSDNQDKLVGDNDLIQCLYAMMQEDEGDEANGQAGKILNTICHLLPLPEDDKAGYGKGKGKKADGSEESSQPTMKVEGSYQE